MISNNLFKKNTGFCQIIDEPVSRCPEREAIVYKDWRITYAEFGSLVNKTARFLRDFGLGKGSRISVISRNCPECLIIEFAAMKLGIVAVKINWRLSPSEMMYMLNLNDVQLLFYRPERPEWGEELSAPFIKDNPVRKAFDLNNTSDISILISLVSQYPDEHIEVEIDPDDSAVHMHTSGTTGKPKCVVYTHGGMLAEIESVKDIYEYSDGQRYQFIAQLFHTACIGAYLSLCTGGSIVLMERFDATTYMKSLVEEKIGAISVVPTVLKWILDENDKYNYDLSKLHVVRYSTCPIPPSVLRRALDKLDCRFYQSYGMTEMGSIITALVAEDHLTGDQSCLTSVGKPIPGAQIKICDDSLNELPVNECGEILVKGPGRMKCYYKQPELTEAVFDDGWYHTKDMGFIDEKGYLHVCGRKDDMIISGGENIYPAEILDAIVSLYDDVLEAVVYGVPDETWGERVKASVVLRPGSKLTAEQLRTHCKKKLASFKVPKEVEFIAELPKNASGKVLVYKLKNKSNENA